MLLDFNMLTGLAPWNFSEAKPEPPPLTGGGPHIEPKDGAARKPPTGIFSIRKAVFASNSDCKESLYGVKAGVEYEFSPGTESETRPSAVPTPSGRTAEGGSGGDGSPMETLEPFSAECMREAEKLSDLYEDYPIDYLYHFGSDGDLYGHYYTGISYDYEEAPKAWSPMELGLSFNRLTGPMPANNSLLDFISAEYNCGIDNVPKQRFCPPPGLSTQLLLAACFAPLMAIGILAGRRGPSRFLADVRFATERIQWRHISNKPVMFIVALSMMWDLFSWSPYYLGFIHSLALLVRPNVAQVAFVIFTNLGTTMQPLGVLVVMAWWLWWGLESWLGPPSVSAWTIMASKDVLKENLRVLRHDQALVLLLCMAVTFVTSFTNFMVLPLHINTWVSVPAEYTWLPPVWVIRNLQVPAAGIALLYASFTVVVFQMIANLYLPRQLWRNQSVAQAVKVSKRIASNKLPGTEAAGSEQSLLDPQMLRLMQPIRWLRFSYVVTAIMLGLLIICSTFSVKVYADRIWEGSNKITYQDQGTVVPVRVGQLPLVFSVACFVGEVLILGIFNMYVWGGGLDTAEAPEAPPHGGVAMPAGAGSSREAGGGQSPGSVWQRLVLGVGKLLRKMVSTKRIGRTHLRRNLLLAVFGLTMVPSAGQAAVGLPMACIVWTIYLILLVCAAIARDEPAGFEDMQGAEGFGLVMLSRDLAEALEASLQDDYNPLVSYADGHTSLCKTETRAVAGPGLRRLDALEQPPRRCCKDFPAGCATCRLLIRRFPATLFRMQETLALSYRWQQGRTVLVCPAGSDPRSPGFNPDYFRNGTVSVNMSRWQRQELLAALRANGHAYVWVDALCIPAALEPPPGTWLAAMSRVLLTRMMALYSAAATTLVLRSLEEDGLRYHQRAWTMQEFCCAQEVIVRSEPPPADGGEVALTIRSRGSLPHPSFADSPPPSWAENPVQQGSVYGSGVIVSFSKEEDVKFRLRRLEVSRRILFALPFWVRQMDAATFRADVELLRYGLREYAAARKAVTCWLPSDLVRALVPMFMNTSVQDEDELRRLVLLAAEGLPEGTTVEEEGAITEAVALLKSE